mgnify:FL=1
MDTLQIKQEIQRIISIFDMGGKAAAKAMHITLGTYHKKLSDKVTNHSFNEKNLTDLITYIKTEAEKL